MRASAINIGDTTIQVDPHYFRPTEVDIFLGDPTKVKQNLGWVPEITLDEMVLHDLDLASKDEALKREGYKLEKTVRIAPEITSLLLKISKISVLLQWV